jgi:hypothetical protein
MPSLKKSGKPRKGKPKEYYRIYRAKKSITAGRIPGIIGNQSYLTIGEQIILESLIQSCKNPLCQPTIKGMRDMVYFLFWFNCRNSVFLFRHFKFEKNAPDTFHFLPNQ